MNARDPRNISNWPDLTPEQQIALLLGAILDRLECIDNNVVTLQGSVASVQDEVAKLKI